MKPRTLGRAQFIGHQDTLDTFAVPLFNICIPGNRLDGSTVTIETINKLGLTQLVDRAGKKLLAVPAPKSGVRI